MTGKQLSLFAWNKRKPCSSGIGEKISQALRGQKHTSERRKKISEGVKRWFLVPEHRENKIREIRASRNKRIEALKGRKLTAKHRKNIGKALKGKERPLEVREKISKTHQGMRHTPETKEKLSNINKGKKITPEQRAKISKALKGRKFSLERRVKIAEINKANSNKNSEGLKRWWLNNPEDKEKHSKVMKKWWVNNPGHRIKIANIMREKIHTLKSRELMSLARIKQMQENPKARGSKYKHGLFWSEKNRLFMFYRSSYELAAYQILEQLSEVESYKRESLCIKYIDKDANVRHTIPDIFITYKSGRKEIIEVKPACFLKRDGAKLTAMKHFADKKGFGFQVWTEKNLKEINYVVDSA